MLYTYSMFGVCTHVSSTHVHVLSDQYAVTYMYTTACDSMHVCADTCTFMNMVCVYVWHAVRCVDHIYVHVCTLHACMCTNAPPVTVLLFLSGVW